MVAGWIDNGPVAVSNPVGRLHLVRVTP